MLVFGGSLGARSINLAAIEAPTRRPTFTSCTSAGAATTPSSRGARYRRGYDLREYLELEDFADALAAADLVVARAGGSVFEIAAHGLPAILVPYPHAAADHQSANARWMADAGAAIVIPDGELTAGAPRARGRRAARRRRRLRDDGRAPRAPRAARCRAEVADELLEAARRMSEPSSAERGGPRGGPGAGGACTSSASAAPG